MPETITRLRVGPHTVGIIGLMHHLSDVAQNHAKESDEAITEALFTRLKKRNYIASPARERYRTAFFTAYLKFVGRESGTEEKGPLSIRILGTGCARCEKLEADVYQILSEEKIAAECDHLRDPKEIAAYGCFASPGLVINEVLKCSGRVPTGEELKTLLKTSTGPHTSHG